MTAYVGRVLRHRPARPTDAPTKDDTLTTDNSVRRQWRSPAPDRVPGFNYASADYVYFVTVCANAGSPFVDARLAREIVQSLDWFRTERGIALYAYCLTPDHLHLLLQLPGDRRLGTEIGSFKTWTTRQSWKLGHKGALWQPRFHDHILRTEEDGLAIATYILDNPVRRGLAREAGEYAWSGMPDPLR